MWIIRLKSPSSHAHSILPQLTSLCCVLQYWWFHFEIPTLHKYKSFQLSYFCHVPLSHTKDPNAKEVRESQDLTNIIWFFSIFSWLLFCLSETVNSQSNEQCCLYVWTVLGPLLACGKYQHCNYQFDVVNREKGIALSFSLSSASPFPQLSEATARY